MLSVMRRLFLAAATCTLLVHTTQAGTDTAAPLPNLKHHPRHESQFLPRAGTPGTFDDGQVSWVDLTSGDGVKTGNDADKIWYIKDAINLYVQRFPDQGARIGLFWAGGFTTEEDFAVIDEFAEINLEGKAHKANDIFQITDFEAMGLDGTKNNLWWRAINRMSKALAAGATNGKAYVYLKNTNCRTLFSPPSQNPQDNDPSANGQSTNGEIFYYAELPMLMRNANIQQIITFSKVNRKFVQTVEWDVNRDTDKPRDFLPDITMDASPIVLPPAAGRQPLRRDILPRDSTPTTLQYQSGLFDVETIFVPGLTANSVTAYTATSNSQLITTTVPIWACTACSSNYNAILVSPSSIWGPVGIPSPPPSYPPLSVGPDLLITPVTLPTATNVPGETYIFLNSTSHGPTTLTTIKGSGFGTGSRSATTQGTSRGSSLNSETTTGAPYPTTPSSQPTNSNQGTGTSLKTSKTPIGSGIGTGVGTGVGTGTGQDSSKTSDSSSSTGSLSQPKNTTSSVTPNTPQATPSGTSAKSGSVTINTSSSTQGPPATDSLGSAGNSSRTVSTSTGQSNFGPSLIESTIVTSGSSGIETTTATFIQGGQITTPIPVTATQTLNPTGTIASSSARELQSSLAVIFPIIQSLIDNPEKPKATDAINAIKGVMPFAENLLDELGPGDLGSQKPCSSLLKRNLNIFSDLFNVVSCVVNGLENAVNDIEGGIEDEFSNIKDVKLDLTDLDNLQKPLDNGGEDSEPSQSQTNPSDSSQTQSSTQTSSTESCTETQTVSDCRVACPTSQSASQSCTTTCYSTVTGCSVTGTTSTTTSTADVCTLPNGDAATATAVPQGPYITAWWDYGISCAGSCTDFAQPSQSATEGTATSTGGTAASTGGTATSAGNSTINGSRSTTYTTTTTTPSRGKSVTISNFSNVGNSIAISNSSNSSNPTTTFQASDSFPTSETVSSSASIPTDPTPTNPLSCAPTDVVPTGVPQSQVQVNITEWCSDDLIQPGIGCDNQVHDGFWLATSCNIPSYSLQYYFPGVTMYFNIALADGSSEFTINSTTCDSALHTVLNGCPPLSAPPDQPLMKYGGSLPVSDGNGHVADFQINLVSVPGSPVQ